MFLKITWQYLISQTMLTNQLLLGGIFYIKDIFGELSNISYPN